MVNDLAEELRPVVMKLSRELRRESSSLGVTGGQVSLLFAVSRAPGIGVRDLAAQERMSAAAMSGHIRRLDKLGLVRREGNPGDGRRHGLHVTPAGRRILRLVKSRRTAWLTTRLEALSETERKAIDRALAPLGRLL
ncbi:MAG: MarR family transcriptional regulator [Gaiellaceae bacterium]